MQIIMRYTPEHPHTAVKQQDAHALISLCIFLLFSSHSALISYYILPHIKGTNTLRSYGAVITHTYTLTTRTVHAYFLHCFLLSLESAKETSTTWQREHCANAALLSARSCHRVPPRLSARRITQTRQGQHRIERCG